MLIGQIQLLSDEAKNNRVIAPDQFMILGRGSGADFIIKDSAVSKKHCKIFYQSGYYRVQDLNSRNFTYINEQKVMGTAMLQHGDVIRIGRSKLLFSLVKHKEKTASLVVDFIDSNKQEITFRPCEKDKKIEEELLGAIVMSLPQSKINIEQLQECFQLKQQSPELAIRNILLEKKLLQEQDVAIVEATLNNILNHEQAKTPSQDEIESEPAEPRPDQKRKQHHLFVRLAQSKGFISQQQLHAAQLLQKKYHQNGVFFTLPEILKKEGYLSPQQVREIQEALGDKIPYHIEGYELLSLIGMGGMGSIYRARQISMDRIVAIKILSEEYRNNQYLNDLFLKEARAVAKLNHKNIIAGYDFGEAQGISYFVMEYVDGPSLQRKLQQCSGRLPINELIDIALQVAQALDHAWEKGLIHRDIKPDNILLTAKGVVKLCDLGLVAHTTDQANPKRKKDFGTPAYMSPEQIRCEADIDIRSDIYSLGGVLYRVMFGRLPFTGTTREIMAKHLGEKVKFPSEGMNKNKLELARIINKMMAKNQKDRFQEPGQVITALTDLQHRLAQMDMANTMEVQITPPRVKMRPRRSLSFKKCNRRKRK